MEEQLKRLIENCIQSWDVQDIYAVSLFVYDDNDNPCTPTVILGYNTETYYRDNIDSAYDQQEARWNYAYWPQNEELFFGVDDTADLVKQWVIQNEFPYYDDISDYDDIEEMDGEQYEELEKITKTFVNVLIQIVKELHSSGFIKNKFGKEIPVLIHELEYYDEIAEQNIEANGIELVKDFVDFCRAC